MRVISWQLSGYIIFRRRLYGTERILFECVAKDSHISAEDMRAQLAARIQKGMNDPDPVRRAQWEEIPCARGNTHAGGVVKVCG